MLWLYCSAQAQITGDLYQDLLRSTTTNNVTKVLLDNYRYWYDHCPWSHYSGIIPPDPTRTSSTLHDLVTASMVCIIINTLHESHHSNCWGFVYLISLIISFNSQVIKENTSLFDNKQLNVVVNATGYTNIVASGKLTTQAIHWRSSAALKEWQKKVVHILRGNDKNNL